MWKVAHLIVVEDVVHGRPSEAGVGCVWVHADVFGWVSTVSSK